MKHGKNPITELKSEVRKLYIALFSVIAIFIAISILSVLFYKDLIVQNIEYQKTINKLHNDISEQNVTIEYLKKLLIAKSPLESSNVAEKGLSFKEKIASLTELANRRVSIQKDIYFNKNKYEKRIGSSEILNIVLDHIKKEYKITSMDDARLKLLPVPVTLSVAQATLEGGAGNSKYAVNFNNPYGIYTFKNKKRQIKRFPNLAQSVENYIKVINGSPALSKFREARYKGESIYSMIKTLNHTYCELGNYSTQLKPLL
jgi:uncharacterized FlgJ-related protein